MKRLSILIFSLFSVLVSTTVYAQDDDAVDDETVTVVKKKPTVKVPTYPMMEVKGVCVDAVTKQPLAGIMVQALNDKNYTAMTEDNGEFLIKVPTFTTALYIHAPEYLSQHVGLGEQGSVIRVELLSDSFLPMYDKTSHVGSSATVSVRSTTSQTVETDMEDLLGADVRSISRSGGPGYGAAMFVRGLTSLNANAQPLIVIDGIVQDMQQTRTSLHYGD